MSELTEEKHEHPEGNSETSDGAPEIAFTKDVHPFLQRMNPGIKNIVIFALMSISVAPLRFITTILLSSAISILSWLETIYSGDKDADLPISNPERHRFFEKWISLCGRLMFFCMGFWINTVGELSEPSEAPVLVAAPHSTPFDGLIFPHVHLPAVVSRTENQHLPFFGKLITYLRPIFVSRAERSSRTATINRIKNRVAAIQTGHPGYNRHLFIFPEGTCTNRSCLITFKHGSFMPGVPVQPILLKFLNPMDTYSWTFQGQGLGACLWFTWCQPINRVTIEFMPVYYPSDEEKGDSYLYAKNVRAVMAKRLGIPTTDHTFEDCRLMEFAEKNNYPMSAALVEFDSVRRRLGLNYDDMQKMLARFSCIDRQRRGKISLPELAKHLSLPVIEPVRELFSLYDRDKSGVIDFRDFISGLSIISEPSESEHSWKVIFDLFDSDGDGRISEVDLSRLLGQNFGMDSNEIEKLMLLMDTDRDGLVSFVDLMNMVKKRPEYNGLLLAYRKMRRQSVTEIQPDTEPFTLGEPSSDSEDFLSDSEKESQESHSSSGSVEDPLETEESGLKKRIKFQDGKEEEEPSENGNDEGCRTNE